jgi:hypothetical protein
MSLVSDLRTNYRLRIGLTLILSIFWLTWLLDLRDENTALIDRYKQTASQLARFNSQQKQAQWLTRAEDAKASLAAAEARIWQNPTLGMTQAEMRDTLLRQLRQANAMVPIVKVSESAGDSIKFSGDSQKRDKLSNSKVDDNAPADLVLVRAQLEFNTDPKVLNNFLTTLSNDGRQVVIEALTVKQPRTEMTVVVWCKLVPAAGSNPAPAASVQ